MENYIIAVIRIRGQIGVRTKIKHTLDLLKLYRKNYCILLRNSESNLGMLNLIKDFTTWGNLDKKTCTLLLEKKGTIKGNKKLTDEYTQKKLKITIKDFIEDLFSNKKNLKDIPDFKPFFRLNPPIKGYGRKGIKIPFSKSGALGDRKEKINDLLKRMV